MAPAVVLFAGKGLHSALALYEIDTGVVASSCRHGAVQHTLTQLVVNTPGLTAIQTQSASLRCNNFR